MKTQTENRKATLYAVLFITATALLLITGYVGIREHEKNKELTAWYEQEQLKTQQQEQQYSEEFAEIESNLSEITAHELVLRNSIRNPEAEVPLNQKERIQNEILLIQSLLDQNNALIDDLNNQVGSRDKQLISYQQKVKNLEKRVEQYKGEIEKYFLENEELRVDLNQTRAQKEELDKTVADQGVQLNQQQSSLDLQSETIATMDKEQNTVYVAVGDLKELKETGLVVNEGGILGVGSTQKINSPVDKSQFVSVDKREYTLIPVYSKKADLIPAHDPSSYELVTYEEGVKWIKITDPDKFWDGSAYLVVATRDGVKLGSEESEEANNH
jgi:antitoxin component HigA of HigAB toxin-antitoxin module